jgi:hypothetical protein
MAELSSTKGSTMSKTKIILGLISLWFGYKAVQGLYYLQRLRKFGDDELITTAMYNVWNGQVLKGTGGRTTRAVFDAVQCEMVRLKEFSDT